VPKLRKGLLAALLAAFLMVVSAGPVLAGPSNTDRQLEAVQSQVRILRKQERKSQTVINFWNHRGSWALYLQHGKCWQVKVVKHRNICKFARRSLTFHTSRVRKVSNRLKRLTAPKLEIGNLSHWICIHRGEGAWNANTGNGYYGGLQMDYSFMSAYGPKVLGFSTKEAMFAKRSTAEQWTPKEQMAVAEYARASGRGYRPWPNTARECGLL